MEIEALLQMLASAPGQVFQTVLLPFLLIFAILWGILGSLNIFKKRINLVLSLILAILAVLTPTFDLLSTYLITMGAQLSLVMFVLVFGFGVLVWAFRGSKDMYDENIAPSRKIEKLQKQKDELIRKAGEAQDGGRTTLAADLRKRAHDIDDQIEYYKSREHH